MSENGDKTYTILLVEDNEADARLSDLALKESGIKYELHIVTNGIEALDFLHQKGIYSNAPVPQLILLDWNLPKYNGKEVLTNIKNNEKIRSIPTIVLTTSDSQLDIFESYRYHANCFIVKPVDLDDFYTIIKQIVQFWFTVVKLPDQEETN